MPARCWQSSFPARPRAGAPDCDELMADWTAAVDAGLVEISGRRAFADRASAGQPDHEQVLTGWMLAAVRGFGLPDEPCAGCLTVMNALAAADGPLTEEQLADAVAEALGDGEANEGEAEPCPGCGRIHDLTDNLDPGDLFSENFFDDEESADDCRGSRGRSLVPG